jgi:hypothetical protein
VGAKRNKCIRGGLRGNPEEKRPIERFRCERIILKWNSEK